MREVSRSFAQHAKLPHYMLPEYQGTSWCKAYAVQAVQEAGVHACSPHLHPLLKGQPGCPQCRQQSIEGRPRVAHALLQR